jgi:hypothetical protein
VRLDEIAKRYADQMQFYCIYIKEIHPDDGVQVQSNIDEGIIFDQPTTDDTRAEIAAACMLRFNFSFPMLLDNMTDEAEAKFVALPERLYVLDADGRVTFKGGLGPHCFDPATWEAAIKELIAS